jgi:hypothetical protein
MAKRRDELPELEHGLDALQLVRLANLWQRAQAGDQDALEPLATLLMTVTPTLHAAYRFSLSLDLVDAQKAVDALLPAGRAWER